VAVHSASDGPIQFSEENRITHDQEWELKGASFKIFLRLAPLRKTFRNVDNESLFPLGRALNSNVGSCLAFAWSRQRPRDAPLVCDIVLPVQTAANGVVSGAIRVQYTQSLGLCGTQGLDPENEHAPHSARYRSGQGWP
jgi:hypothetical protein